MDLDVVWSFSGSDLSTVIEREAAGNLKRTLVNHGKARDLFPAPAGEFLSASTEIKTIWVPYGE